MRLLHTTELKLKEFLGEVPRYAILSHTWEEEEVSFQDMQGDLPLNKKGFSKVQMGCHVARRQLYEYIWIDTCCIDKTSSAELSEAINSMYRWYSEANICYAYLADVPYDPEDDHQPVSEAAILQSRWFTRGWTLQEMIAPTELNFFSASWDWLGSRRQFYGVILEATGVNIEVLVGEESINDVSAARKMSWASKRSTTRVEDRA